MHPRSVPTAPYIRLHVTQRNSFLTVEGIDLVNLDGRRRSQRVGSSCFHQTAVFGFRGRSTRSRLARRLDTCGTTARLNGSSGRVATSSGTQTGPGIANTSDANTRKQTERRRCAQIVIDRLIVAFCGDLLDKVFLGE